MQSESDIVIVGTGFAGLGMAIKLKEAGIHGFTVLEADEGVGGTWRANHYPGAACDIESHLYSFSFAPNPRWSFMFARQKEILDYLERCADEYDIRRHIRFRCAVKRAAWNEQTGRWDVETSDGRLLRARVLVSGCGGLSRPSYPDIRGVEDFTGGSFHSARWDDTYDFSGKRVAIIGTGATSIQIAPEIAPKASKLDIFQRTAPWIIPRPDHPISERQRARYARTPALQALVRNGLYLRHEAMALGFIVEPRINKVVSRIARRHLARSIPNPELRQKLTPDYTLGCKRILLSNDYYPTLVRPNVELVTDPIERIVANGIATTNGTRAYDAIILATGFQAAESCAPFDVRGRNGRDLSALWNDGAEAYLGTTVTGFPNLFTIVGPNTGLGHSSMVYMIESQIAYVMDCLRTLSKQKMGYCEVRSDVQQRYNEKLHARLAKTVWATGCKAWYRTRSGKNTTLWPGFTFEFRYRTRKFDAENYDLYPSPPQREAHSQRDVAVA